MHRFEQPRWAYTAVFVLAALVLLPALGSTGLWDPWEMRVAHLAQGLVSPARVLVAERASGPDSSDYAFTRELTQAGGAEVSGPLALVPEALSRAGSVTPKLIQTHALNALRARVYHGVVLDAGLWAKDLQDTAGLEALAGELERIEAANSGASVVLAWPEVTDEAAIRQALQAGRVRATHSDWRRSTGQDAPTDETTVDALVEELSSDPLFAPPAVTVVGAATPEVAAQIMESVPSPWLRVQFKRDGISRTRAPLDAWLLAATYSLFGSSEATTRAMFALLALLGVAVTLWGLHGLVPVPAAALAALVLATCPLYFAQARFAAGEIAISVALAGSVLAYGRILAARSRLSAPLVLAGGALVAFLAEGLFGLLAVWLCLGLYLAVALDTRRRAWAPFAALTAVFAAAAAWVLTAQDWSFAHHFRFTARLFTDGPIAEARTFDAAIRQLGFGLLPWSALLPFAIPALLTLRTRGNEPESERLGVLIFGWAVGSAVLWMVGAAALQQHVVPVAPAAAIAVALWLHRLVVSPERNGVAAFAILLLLLVLVRETREYGDALFTYLAVDPAFVKEGSSSLRFPEDFKVSRGYLGFGALCALLFCASLGGFGQKLVSFARRMRTGTLLEVAAAVALVALSAWWLLSVVGLYDDLASLTGAKDTAGKRFASRALTRPEQLAFLALASALCAAGLFARSRGDGPPPAPGARPRLWSRLAARIPLHRLEVAAPLVAALGLAVAASSLFRVARPEGSSPALRLLDPGVIAMALLAGVSVWLRRAAQPPTFLARTHAWLVQWPSWAAPLFLSGLAALFFGVRLSKESWQVPPEQWALLPLAFGVLAAVWIAALRGPRPLFWSAVAAWAVYVSGALYPLVGRWLDLVRNNPTGRQSLHYIFFRSPISLALSALVIVLGLALVWQVVARLRRSRGATGGSASPPSSPSPRLEALGRWVVRLDAPAFAVVAVAGSALAMAAVMNHRVWPQMSLHVSQKHILDTYRAAAGANPEGRLFSYGGGAADDDHNFYTNSVPKLSDRGAALEILAHRKDVAAKVRAGDGARSEAVRVFPGFSRENDRDGDGTRDFPADAGVAHSVEQGALTDLSKQWAPDQWKGFVLVDSTGKEFAITGNDNHRLTLASGRPAGAGPDSAQSRYAIDHPDAPAHQSTAARSERVFFMLPKGQLSDLNHRFREAAGGAHLPILDDRSSQIVLAASWLEPGEESLNPIDHVTHTREEFAALQGVRRVRATFEGKIALVGYRLEEEVVRRRKEVKIHTYFEVLTPLTKSYKIFLHIDKPGSSNRIHGDHYVLNQSGAGDDDSKCNGCYQTTHWLPGDVIEDVFEREVPLGTPSGTQEMWLGLFEEASGDRLKVESSGLEGTKTDGQNRVRMGTFVVQ
jgi:hypothetical protein